MDTIPNLVTVDLDVSRGPASRAAVAGNADRLLDAFAKSGTKATFFASRSFVDGHASVASRIAAQGHELAALTHEPPALRKPYCPSFLEELDATREAIEQATAVRVRGHRNAKFAVDYESEWTYDVLVERGIEYDSSRLPPKYVEHGCQPVPREPHAVRRWGGMLIEIPISTADVMAVRLHLGAPGTIRGLPLSAWSAIAAERRRRGEAVVLRLRADGLTPRTVERAGRIAGRLQSTSVASALPQLHRHAPIVES